MLPEVWAWLTTPCRREARRLGYLHEAIAFERRSRRCRFAWQSHVTHCHAAVLDSLAHCQRHGTALVLGSGLALEFPLHVLATRFERVILIDMVHLPSVRRLAGSWSNVTMLEADLTGLAECLMLHGQTWEAREFEELAPTDDRLKTLGAVDWVLSANVLSQLPMRPVAWLARHRPDLAETTLENLGRRLMARHLKQLSELQAECCLIADAEQWVFDGTGALVEHSDYAAAFDLDRLATSSWEWPVAPPGELSGGWRRTHRVVACSWGSSPAAG